MYASNVCLKPQVSAWFRAIKTQISLPRCGTKTFRFKQSCQRLRIQMKLSDTKHLVQKVSEYLKISCIPANMLKSPQWPSLKHLRGTWDDDLDTVHLDTMVYLLVYEKHVQNPFRFQFWGFIMLLTSTHPHHLLYQVPGTSKHRHPCQPGHFFTLCSSQEGAGCPSDCGAFIWLPGMVCSTCCRKFPLVLSMPWNWGKLWPPQNHKNCWSGINKTCVWSMLILLFEVPYHTTSYHQKGLNTRFRNQTCQGKFPIIYNILHSDCP